MIPKIWINKITFSDLSEVTFDQNDIIVLVGPNNAGKSVCIREAFGYLFSKVSNSKVIKSIIFSREGTIDDLYEFLENISKKEFRTNPEPYYNGFGFSLYGAKIQNSWAHFPDGIGDLANVFSQFLSTEARLSSSNPAKNILLTSESAKHPINMLQKSDSLRNGKILYT
jgi:AAA15 family ATPase/GTPase